ncbi:MAG: hypothetical protein AB7D57_08525 [Desulfovibrionaceae bacterium]
MLTDWQELVPRLQRALARVFTQAPWVLNTPGRSVACKIDPLYYLAPQPGFSESLGRWAGVPPERVDEALVRTGNIITRAPERAPWLVVRVVFGGREQGLRASFLDADFVERGLRLYAGLEVGLPVSDLRLAAVSRPTVTALFEGKTAPQDFAFA